MHVPAPVSVAVVVPVRRFEDAKSRLADALTPTERQHLSRNCAERVLDAALGFHRVVVSDDRAVAEWAESLGVEVVMVSSVGLNAALDEALPVIIRRCAPDHIVVCHADLPAPEGLRAVVEQAVSSGVPTVITDKLHDGTNVLIAPTAQLEIAGFHYGPGSAERHREHFERVGTECHVMVHATLSIDLDRPDDLSHPVVIDLIGELIRARSNT